MGNLVCRFVRLIADRQLDQPFRVEGLPVDRREKPVYDYVVDKVGPHRTGVAEKVDLDRRRPVGEDRSPAVRRVTGEVDQDVDPVGMHLLGGRRRRHVSDVDEPIKGAGEASAHCAAIIRTAGIADDPEPSAVVTVDHSSDQKRYRMLAEVRRQIAEADPLARVFPRARESPGRHGHVGRNPADAGELLLGRR